VADIRIGASMEAIGTPSAVQGVVTAVAQQRVRAGVLRVVRDLLAELERLYPLPDEYANYGDSD
jgi:hypothetical protein